MDQVDAGTIPERRENKPDWFISDLTAGGVSSIYI